MLGGDDNSIAAAFHQSVCAIIRGVLNEYAADPLGFIKRNTELNQKDDLGVFAPHEGHLGK